MHATNSSFIFFCIAVLPLPPPPRQKQREDERAQHKSVRIDFSTAASDPGNIDHACRQIFAAVCLLCSPPDPTQFLAWPIQQHPLQIPVFQAVSKANTQFMDTLVSMLRDETFPAGSAISTTGVCWHCFA